ncbi:MAG: DUF6537 domain-containing protein, partial [Pseudomonadota bacterium]
PLGRKRAIDQSACNMDLSCLKGFCPSFVTVEGAVPRRTPAADLAIPTLPEPAIPPLEQPWNVLVTGIGGTGVVTVGALISMAAHLEGRGAAEMQMAGLAQKGGAVSIHCRIAPRPEDIASVRLSLGEADAVIAGDMVVAAAAKALGLMAPGRTRAVLSTEAVLPGQFTRDRDFTLPADQLIGAVAARIGADALTAIDAPRIAGRLLGNTIYANVLLLGAAWQAGLLPLSRAALEKAIALNGAGVDGNLRAFELGRWAAEDPVAVIALCGMPAPVEEDDAAAADRRAAHLTAYQDARLARRYRAAIARMAAAEDAAGITGLSRAVAEGYFKLLAYKDEYEVARLHHETLSRHLAETFEDGHGRVTFHLAPPLLSRRGDDGRPIKRAFGPWMARAFALLRHGKLLRGTPLDPFGHTEERRAERAMITDYEALMAEVAAGLTAQNAEIAIALARLPLSIRGFGHVKDAAAARAAEEREALLAAFRGQTPAPLATAAE